MKKLTAILFVIITSINLSAQKDKDYTYYFQDNTFGEQYGIEIKAKNIVSKHEYVKLGLEIYNGTDDFIIFFKDECKFTVNGNNFYPEKEKKGKIIYPGAKKTFTVKSEGKTDYLTEDIDFTPGGIYTFPAEGETVNTEPFHLPPDRNEINNGVFKLNMLKLKKQTDETAVQFKCTYTGKKIGTVTPSNCVLRTENGKEWATVNSKEKMRILQKNEKLKFTVSFKIPGKITDMQFAEMDIVWKNTFAEADKKKIDFDNRHFYIDTSKTKIKK